MCGLRTWPQVRHERKCNSYRRTNIINLGLTWSKTSVMIVTKNLSSFISVIYYKQTIVIFGTMRIESFLLQNVPLFPAKFFFFNVGSNLTLGAMNTITIIVTWPHVGYSKHKTRKLKLNITAEWSYVSSITFIVRTYCKSNNFKLLHDIDDNEHYHHTYVNN